MAVTAESDPETYAAYASAFVLVVGIVFLVAGVARLGFITQFLSKPVMDGFVMGLAIFVAVGQLNKLFGVAKPDGNTVEKLIGIIKELPQANWPTFVVGALALALLFVLPRLSKKIPAGLIVLFGAIILSSVLDLEGNFGVAIVGSLPQGLPSFVVPAAPFTTYLAMVLPAIGVLLVAFSEALGVSREFAEKHGYEVDPDQELNAHAVANLASAFFGGMIAAGSMSASAVKEGAGARSQVANLVAWAVTIITLLFLTPLFKTLPEAVLAALIIHAVWHIIASRKLQEIRTSRVPSSGLARSHWRACCSSTCWRAWSSGLWRRWSLSSTVRAVRTFPPWGGCPACQGPLLTSGGIQKIRRCRICWSCGWTGRFTMRMR